MADVKKIATRQAYGEFLAEYGAERKDLIAMSADLSGSNKTDIFEKAFPERFVEVGISEQDKQYVKYASFRFTRIAKMAPASSRWPRLLPTTRPGLNCSATTTAPAIDWMSGRSRASGSRILTMRRNYGRPHCAPCYRSMMTRLSAGMRACSHWRNLPMSAAGRRRLPSVPTSTATK